MPERNEEKRKRRCRPPNKYKYVPQSSENAPFGLLDIYTGNRKSRRIRLVTRQNDMLYRKVCTSGSYMWPTAALSSLVLVQGRRPTEQPRTGGSTAARNEPSSASTNGCSDGSFSSAARAGEDRCAWSLTERTYAGEVIVGLRHHRLLAYQVACSLILMFLFMRCIAVSPPHKMIFRKRSN